MTVSLDANDNRTLPYWYTGMNNMASAKVPYVNLVYASYEDETAGAIARQISENLREGGFINDEAFLFTKTVSKVWKLTNYPTFFSTKDKETEKLPFPDPSSVEHYIDD